MRKIAYLIGVSGAGKGYVADWLRGDFDVIVGDTLQHRTGLRLCPFARPERVWHWDLWEALIKHCDVRSAIRPEIEEMYSHLSASDKPILAEAAILGMGRWRIAFRDSLNAAGFDLAEERVFWLDVSPDELVARVRGRGRPYEGGFDLAEATRRIAWYREIVDPCDVIRLGDTDGIINAIHDFRHLGPGIGG